ncbi:unnamed protein product, partial [Candidula unifasciata]
ETETLETRTPESAPKTTSSVTTTPGCIERDFGIPNSNGLMGPDVTNSNVDLAKKSEENDFNFKNCNNTTMNINYIYNYFNDVTNASIGTGSSIHFSDEQDQEAMYSLDGPATGAIAALSDRGLSFLASRLGGNWTAVVLQLGVPQVLIEQLKNSHQHDVHQQIMSALRRWREKDRDTKSPFDKLKFLFDVLTSESIGLTELVEQFKQHFQL